MPRTWDALDGHRSRIYEEDGRYTVKVDAIGIDIEDVITLAHTLLEAAGVRAVVTHVPEEHLP